MKEVSNFQEVKTLCIECVSPVNIADGIKLNPKDYLFDRKQGRVYFLNQLAWHKFIYAKKLLPAYEKYITDFREKRSLFEWLHDSGYGIEDVKAAIKASTSVALNQLHFEERKSLNEIICQEKLSTGEVYIPGSSIKGVIRTAILFNLLQKNPTVKNKYWNEINAVIQGNRIPPKNWKTELGKKATAMENELLHKLKFGEDGKGPKSNNAVCSVMRGISCGDAYAKEIVTTAVLQKVDAGFDKRTGRAVEKSLPIFRESILPGNKFYCTLKVEKAICKEIGITSVDDVILMMEKYFAFTKGVFERAFKAEHPHAFADIDNANAYLGSNTGFLTKTLMAAMAPTERDAVNVIRSWLNVSFRSHNHIPLDKHISPRTLKTTYYNGRQYLMGLVMVGKDE